MRPEVQPAARGHRPPARGRADRRRPPQARRPPRRPRRRHRHQEPHDRAGARSTASTSSRPTASCSRTSSAATTRTTGSSPSPPTTACTTATEGYGNGDSGLYPGSGPEGHCQRYGIEIRNSSSHDNVLGQSGTAGNGTWVHDSKWFDNGVGIVNDSFASGHPGMPQDCSKWEDNDVYSNNQNFFDEGNQEYCAEDAVRGPPARPRLPAVPEPGRHRLRVLRRERQHHPQQPGVGQLALGLPAVLGAGRRSAATTDRGGPARHVARQPDHRQHVRRRARRRQAMPNGVDIFWDEQGDGNCWEGNTRHRRQGDERPGDRCRPARPAARRGAASRPDKIGPEVPCATWDPKDNPDPPGCTWFDTPPRPRAAVTRRPRVRLAAAAALVGGGGARRGAAPRGRRRRRDRQAGVDGQAERASSRASRPTASSRRGSRTRRCATSTSTSTTCGSSTPTASEVQSTVRFLEAFAHGLWSWSQRPSELDRVRAPPPRRDRRRSSPGQTAPVDAVVARAEGRAAAGPASTSASPRSPCRAPATSRARAIGETAVDGRAP